MNPRAFPARGRIPAAWWLAGALAAVPAWGAAMPGADLYLRVCSACHGENGDGRSLAAGALRTRPRDFSAPEARLVLTREYMIAIVRDGRPHTAMVGRTQRLSQREIEEVVDFIRVAFLPPEEGTARARDRQRYARLCASCHGARGQGGAGRPGEAAAPALAAARARPGLDAVAIAEAVLDDAHARRLRSEGAPLDAGQARAIADYIATTFVEAAGRPAAR